MDFYWIKTHKLIKRLFPNQIWDLPNTEKKIYLTFDDGPTPEITEWILAVLEKQDIKATFFCLGDNIRKHPNLFQKIISAGHKIGNHTYSHLQGWKTDNKNYMENIRLCEEEIKKQLAESNWQKTDDILAKTETSPVNIDNATARLQTNLFRPPYGKIRPSQTVQLRKKGYKIIMWDVLSADFDHTVAPEQCLQNVVKNTTQGSVIVFHDSRKAFRNVEYALPKAIEILKEKGFQFSTID